MQGCDRGSGTVESGGMNPAKAWLLLTTRSIGVEILPPGYGRLTPADAAAALHGLPRGPFLLGMAMLAGDLSVVEELTMAVKHQIVLDLACSLNWNVDRRGDRIWSRLAALAVFEALNGQRCLVCNGKGRVSREIVIPENLRRAHGEKAREIAEQNLRDRVIRALSEIRRLDWIIQDCELVLENLRALRIRDTRETLLKLRAKRQERAKYERQIAEAGGTVRCRMCRGAGIFRMRPAHRAWLAGVPRRTWYRNWDGRYPVIQGELDRWKDQCLEHVRRWLDGRDP
jgi:hypothetical protein